MAMTEHAFISIVIPTKNRKMELIQTVHHLRRLDYPPDRYEIILVDDGSTDGTHQLHPALLGENVRMIRRAAAGCYAARNTGIHYATGQIVGFTDDDCRPAEDWLKTIDRTLADPNVAAVYGQTYCDRPPSTFIHSVINSGENTITCNMAVRKHVLIKVGLFDVTFFFYFGDEDLGNRLRKSGYRIVYAPDLKVLHPSKYQSFLTYLRRRRGLRYLFYMHRKFPEKRYLEKYKSVLQQAAKRLVTCFFPIPLALLDRRFLLVLPVLLLLLWALDFCELVSPETSTSNRGNACKTTGSGRVCSLELVNPFDRWCSFPQGAFVRMASPVETS